MKAPSICSIADPRREGGDDSLVPEKWEAEALVFLRSSASPQWYYRLCYRALSSLAQTYLLGLSLIAYSVGDASFVVPAVKKLEIEATHVLR